jgi:hypothetical protein
VVLPGSVRTAAIRIGLGLAVGGSTRSGGHIAVL